MVVDNQIKKKIVLFEPSLAFTNIHGNTLLLFSARFLLNFKTYPYIHIHFSRYIDFITYINIVMKTAYVMLCNEDAMERGESMIYIVFFIQV